MGREPRFPASSKWGAGPRTRMNMFQFPCVQDSGGEKACCHDTNSALTGKTLKSGTFAHYKTELNVFEKRFLMQKPYPIVKVRNMRHFVLLIWHQLMSRPCSITHCLISVARDPFLEAPGNYRAR